MTITLLSLALCVAIVALTASPMFRAGANRSLGTGKEDDSPVRRWQEEKDRLTAQLRDNDLALAEGRIDAAAHSGIASKLAGDAEHALSRLREAREALAPAAADTARRAGRLTAALMGVAVVAAAYGVHAFASRGDVDMNRSPHAAGQIPLPPGAAKPEGGAASSAGVPLGADGAPDIGAMVARLEARIAGGDYTTDDVAMLMRSYGVLGRDADAKALLAKASAKFPDDLSFRFSFIETALGGSDPADIEAAEKMVADILAASPDLAEARWYRSLFLVRRGDFDAARKELRALLPLVTANPQAASAVNDLLARLDVPAHDTPRTQP